MTYTAIPLSSAFENTIKRYINQIYYYYYVHFLFLKKWHTANPLSIKKNDILLIHFPYRSAMYHLMVMMIHRVCAPGRNLEPKEESCCVSSHSSYSDTQWKAASTIWASNVSQQQQQQQASYVLHPGIRIIRFRCSKCCRCIVPLTGVGTTCHPTHSTSRGDTEPPEGTPSHPRGHRATRGDTEPPEGTPNDTSSHTSQWSRN